MPLRPLLPLFLLAASCAAPSTAVRAPVEPVALDWPAHGKPLEHVEAFQNERLKVGLISLQGGARMPEHASALPVLLTASSGRGTVTTARGEHPIDPAHAVFLAGGERHAVIAAEGEVLRIAVMALKEGAAPADSHGP